MYVCNQNGKPPALYAKDKEALMLLLASKHHVDLNARLKVQDVHLFEVYRVSMMILIIPICSAILNNPDDTSSLVIIVMVLQKH